jgi:hypothetical protein
MALQLLQIKLRQRNQRVLAFNSSVLIGTDMNPELGIFFVQTNPSHNGSSGFGKSLERKVLRDPNWSFRNVSQIFTTMFKFKINTKTSVFKFNPGLDKADRAWKDQHSCPI